MTSRAMTMNNPIKIFMAICLRSIRKLRRLVKRALPLMGSHARICTSTLAERCESGRIDMLGKHASRQRDRGFESHPLRQTELARPRGLAIVTERIGAFSV